MNDLLTYRGTVYPWHCDHMGHMNVMHYVGKFDEATWQFFRLVGLTPQRLREGRRGMAAVEQKITYRKELLPGASVRIQSALLEVRAKSIRFRHQLFDEDTEEISAECELVGVHLDLVTRRAVELPAGLQLPAE